MAATENQIRTILNGILGQNGQVLTNLTNALTAQNNTMQQGQERATAKVSDFSGTEAEDPVDWLRNFNRAAETNRWTTDQRKVQIAGGFMRGIAANWFDDNKATMNNAWGTGTGNNNTENFEDMFQSRFVNETRKNQWYQELTTLRQQTDETIDEYTNKFTKLAARVDLQDDAQRKRMYFMGINPAYTALVYAQNPATLVDAIEAAKRVEVGFNFASGTGPKKANTSSSTITKTLVENVPVVSSEVDELTKKLEQLTVSYANLSAVLLAQNATSTNAGRSQNPRNGPPPRNRNLTCFNCGKVGHFRRECTAPRKGFQRRTRFENTRNVNFVDFEDEEYYTSDYDEESETYYYEREAYPAMRSGRKYSTGTKAVHPKRKEMDEFEELQRNTEFNSLTPPEVEMEDAEEPSGIAKTKKVEAIRKPRAKMMPAPIESLTEFNVAQYLQNLPCGLTVGQAAHAIPKYRSGMQKATRRYREPFDKEREANLAESDEEHATAAKCNLRVNGKAISVIVDSGAATNIMTRPLMNRLGCQVSKPSRIVVVVANGDKTRSLGIGEDVGINFGKLRVDANFQVLESQDEVLILGNGWLRKNKARMDWYQNSLLIRTSRGNAQVPVTFTKTSSVRIQEEDDEEFEYEDEELIESPIYYSDVSMSSEEESLDYNPWADVVSLGSMEEGEEEGCDEKEDNPATYLAEIQAYAVEEKVTKSLAVGPLDYHHQQQLDNLLHSYQDVCAKNQTEIGRTTEIKHRIYTGDAMPIAQKPYRTNPENTKFLNEEIQRMEQAGIVRKSFSPWASPVVIVGKKGGDKRFCVDYRKLNAVTKVDAYPLPRIDDLLDSLGGANWFSTLDLASGFWQISMQEEDIEKTAFITANGLYEFMVMPFGLNNAPGTFQRLMNWVLQDYLGKFVAVYIDDVIIFTKGTLEQHLDHLKQVLQTLRESILKIKLKKCQFCLPSLSFLGHVVGRGGIQPDPEKIRKIKEFPVPGNVSQLRAALGLFGYYRKFIKDFSRHAKPMTELLKKDRPYAWEEKQQNSFERLKEMLIKAPILQYPDFEKSFTLFTDASKNGLGAVLSQKKDNKECVIAYASRSTNKSEANYGITDLECLAVVWAVQHFQHYLFNPFTIVTDHSALKWLKTCKIPRGRRARWIMELQQYNFSIEHRAGKANANADALSRMYDQEVHCYFAYTEEISEEEGYDNNPEESEPESSHSRKRQKLGEGSSAHYLVDPQGNPIGRMEVQTSDLTGSQYLFDLGPAPGESEAEPMVDWENHLAEYSDDDDSVWSPHYTDSYENPNEVTIEEWREDGTSVVLSTYEKDADAATIYRAYQYSQQKLFNLYLSNIVVKQVIAGQPIRRGGSRCTDSCYYGETVDHHTHTYCKLCKRNLFADEVEHECTWGTMPGETHPEMDPRYLVNIPWWPEPMIVQQENLYALLCYLERLYNNLPFYEQDLEIEIAELD